MFLVTNELMQMAFRTYQFEQAISRNPDDLEKAKSSLTSRFKSIHKNYDIDVDKGVFENVMPFYNKNIDASIYDKTAFTNLDSALKLLDGDVEKISENLSKDAAYQYAKPMIKEFFSALNAEYGAKNEPIVCFAKTIHESINGGFA